MLVLRKKRVCNNSKKLRRGSEDLEGEQEHKKMKLASLSRGTSMIIDDFKFSNITCAQKVIMGVVVDLSANKETWSSVSNNTTKRLFL